MDGQGKEVANRDWTFLSAVWSEIVLQPGLMDWNEWPAWGQGRGQRIAPTTRRWSGLGTILTEYDVIWNTAMGKLYGHDWKKQWGTDGTEYRERKGAAREARQVGPAHL